MLGVARTTDACGELSHHADRRDVGRASVEQGSKDALRRGQVVVEQGASGAKQLRVAHGGANRGKLGLRRCIVVAGAPKRRPEQAKRLGVVGDDRQDLPRLFGGERG
jgi:hypothetical protein